MKHHGIERIGRTVSVNKAARQCLDKKRYDSRNKARDRAAMYLRDGKCEQAPYRCTLCGGWHLATVKAKPQKIVAPQLRRA